MSETAELFAAMGEQSVIKRGQNRERGIQLLEKYKIEFTTNNNGVHLIVIHDDRIWDYWPGTGKWKERGAGPYYRGIFPLLTALGIPHGYS